MWVNSRMRQKDNKNLPSTNTSSLVSRLSNFDYEYYDYLIEKFNSIQSPLSEVQQSENCSEPPDDFRSIVIAASIEELLSTKKPFLRKNIIRGPYRDVDQYLDIHFRLLREDFHMKLRTGITSYFSPHQEEFEGINVYKGVVILTSITRAGDVLYRIALDINDRKNLNLENSFMFGSLLYLSHNNFQSTLRATVNGDIKNGVVNIKFEDNTRKLTINEESHSYVMIQPLKFYEPYKHVLRTLQSLNCDNLPLQNYLIHVKTKLERPKYLKRLTTYSLTNTSSYYLVDDITQWPTAENLCMDESQRRATHLALNSSLAIIQGPPGTGKTHIGLKIIEILLRNKRFNGPILVVCMTNHALDQFLEGMVEFTQNIVRVGNQSESTILENYNLRQHKNLRPKWKDGSYMNYKIFKENEIIGMTTSCAARLSRTLQKLKPPIVIVEEAAEVLEAHTISALSSGTQHLILIGDHKQLRPKVECKLEHQYNLGVSLFERMINNNIPYATLEIQYRMRPEISRLLVPHIYPNLKDHPSVQNYEHVKGMISNVFFLKHNNPEEKYGNTTSFANQFEADFLLGLCNYLLQQGYSPADITILTPYLGQSEKLKELIQDEDIRIVTVDSFQGEESQIILLSYVRSTDGKLGFLKEANRVNVALSRAKIGLYCVGNFDFFAANNRLWRNIMKCLEKTKSTDYKMTLKCQRHSTLTEVKEYKDFSQLCPEGGCLEQCLERFRSSYRCRKTSHPLSQECDFLLERPIEPQHRMRPEITRMRSEITRMRSEITRMRPEITRMRPEITRMRPEITPMRPEITRMRPEITPIRPEITRMRRIGPHKKSLVYRYRKTCLPLSQERDFPLPRPIEPQHRMRPEISPHLIPHINPNLTDHSPDFQATNFWNNYLTLILLACFVSIFIDPRIICLIIVLGWLIFKSYSVCLTQ